MNATERTAQKAAVVESLGNGSTRAAACEAAGIDRSTFYQWLKRDSRFLKRVEQTLVSRVTMVEDALYERALAGDVKAQIHWLRCREPDKWEPHRRRSIDANVNMFDGGGPVDYEEIRRRMKERIEAEQSESP